MGWPEAPAGSCHRAAAARAGVHPAHRGPTPPVGQAHRWSPPGYDRENDYDVVFRDRKVGRIWKYDYTGKVSGEMARWLWHWDWRDVDGRKDAEGHCGSLEAAMAQFRAAWDAPGSSVITR